MNTKLFIYNNMKKLKILLINPMYGLEGFLPIGLSTLISVLKQDHFENIKLFDTTFYNTTDFNDRKQNESTGIFKKSDDPTFKYKSNYEKDLKDLIDSFKPDIIGITIPTFWNHKFTMEILDNIDYNGVIIVGGKSVINSPNMYTHNKIDGICTGEGEISIVEICNKLEDKLDISDTKGFWFHKLNKRNGLNRLLDLTELPPLDWSLFDDRQFYKPFDGKIYRYGHVEFSRGCVFKCSYCINEKLQSIFKGKGKYYRKKEIPQFINELKYLKEKYNIKMFKFWDEDFFSITEKKLEELSIGYREINLPFLITGSFAHVTDKKAKLLSEMGCVNASCGIENGNEDFRQEILNRKMTNKQITNGVRLLQKYNIRINALNMIGLPHETRENIFETINLNRELKVEHTNVNILQPWPDTKIRQIAIDANFMKPDVEHYDYYDTCLTMSDLSKPEIRGLYRTFLLYVKLPKLLWWVIRIAENDNFIGNRIYKLLVKLI